MRAVIGLVRNPPGRRQDAAAQLVQDLARLGIAKRIILDRLQCRQRPQGGGRQVRLERQGHVCREQAVAAEQRHEPRQARRWQRPVKPGQRAEAERGQIEQALPVGVDDRVVIGLQRRGIGHPPGECHRHLRLERAEPAVADPWSRLDLTDAAGHVDAGLPPLARPESDLEHGPVRRDVTCGGEDQPGRSSLTVALHPQQHTARFRGRRARVVPDLRRRVLDLEQVGEVSRIAKLDPDLSRLVAVVLDDDVSCTPPATIRSRRTDTAGLTPTRATAVVA